MPKRAATPPPSDDEPRYFTINQSYPLNANWEMRADQISCARWIAEIIGPQNLYALMYKPSARGMVLIEVDRNFQEHQLLLGQHQWQEILVSPSAEQKERYSQIFHSTYSSNRNAQKDGWKRLHVEDKWFKGWKRHSGKEFRIPYPATHWCATPPEDRTDKPMCRPLPTAVLPPPVVPAPPVVGSSQWLQERSTPNPASNSTLLRGAWAGQGRGGAPQGRSAPVNTSTQSTLNANAPSAPRASSGPAWNGRPLQAKNSQPTPSASNATIRSSLKQDTGAWGKGPTPFPAMASTSSNASSSTAVPTKSAPRAGAWGAPNSKITSAATAPSAPPGIPIKVVKATAKAPPPPAKAQPSSVSPPALSREDNTTSSGSSSSSTFSWADDVQAEMEQLEITHDNVTIANPSNTIAIDPMADLEGEDEMDEYDYPIGAINTSSNIVPGLYVKESSDSVENLWANHDEEDEVVEEFQCSVHEGNSRLCKKGICTERAAYERKKKREKEREDREKGQQNSKGKGKGRAGNKNGDRTKSRDAWGDNSRFDDRHRSVSNSRSPAVRSRGSPSPASTAKGEEQEQDPWVF
ncbi:hypothetical protein PM082_016346 [Marasmius tenuissimus]|nr:hypothetical protein PM082_016346 [Marasmius tenuissimus]